MLRHTWLSNLRATLTNEGIGLLRKSSQSCTLPRLVFPHRQYRSSAVMSKRNETAEERAARKALVKEQKAEKKKRREGHIDNSYGQKPCDLCEQPKDLLIRCQIDKSENWHMVCGKCWNEVSGGVVDGDDSHPDYRYGGLWKNLHKKDRVVE